VTEQPSFEELSDIAEVGIVDEEPGISIPKVPQTAGDDYRDVPEDSDGAA
jgi:hypothetical protein